ncbi:MAG: pyridoxine 5'-phosphate synthase, partial [Bacteroidales bacterium]|nr:pyridoxine 5'-phosphate synthase [Bacteroidales bacterium]
IRYRDVLDLRHEVHTEFNIEGYPSDFFIDLVLKVKPEQVTLVPDPPGALTSNAGWDTISRAAFLKEVVGRFQDAGIRTSIFIGTEPELIEAAAYCGTNRVELYTEPYASQYPLDPDAAVAPFVAAALVAQRVGLGLNAGHDLSLDNLAWFVNKVPGLLEVSIGHALISDALYLGLESTIAAYLKEIRKGLS